MVEPSGSKRGTLYDIPEWIEGEPALEVASGLDVGIFIALQLLLLLVLGLGWVFTAPLYGVLRLFLRRPPFIPSWRQFRRYAGRLLVEQAPPPGISVSRRIRILLDLGRAWLMLPPLALCWFLDDLLYGRALRKTPIIRPLFEISGARSGSTQLARYLEDDPNIVTPSVLQCTFPFVWLWKLAPLTIGRFITHEQVRRHFERALPPGFYQRHELDPFRTDTFEVIMFMTHLMQYSSLLGPEMMMSDLSHRKVQAHNREIWEGDLVDLIDALGRKVLYHAGPTPEGKPRTLMVKGHFLASAPALERRFPDASFLTMVREPDKRLQSCINYLRVSPPLLKLGPTPWGWLVHFFMEGEAEYCVLEMAWYTAQTGSRKCVLRFDDYIRDLEGAMTKVYRECFDITELPPHVPIVHAKRHRTNYMIDRSLEQLEVDVVQYRARLAPYYAWCKGQGLEPAEVGDRPRNRASSR